MITQNLHGLTFPPERGRALLARGAATAKTFMASERYYSIMMVWHGFYHIQLSARSVSVEYARTHAVTLVVTGDDSWPYICINL